MSDDITSEHFLERQADEETKEHEAVQPDEAHAARRRADKAGYLAEKLAEQERSR